MHKEAGRPWPVVCEDDVIDYMILEAVALKVRKADHEAAKLQELKKLKKQKEEELKKYS